MVVAQVPLPEPPPVGHVVLHTSELRQSVPNVPVVANRLVEVAEVEVLFDAVKF